MFHQRIAQCQDRYSPHNANVVNICIECYVSSSGCCHARISCNWHRLSYLCATSRYRLPEQTYRVGVSHCHRLYPTHCSRFALLWMRQMAILWMLHWSNSLKTAVWPRDDQITCRCKPASVYPTHSARLAPEPFSRPQFF